jgi:hypothetical protein
MRRSAATAPTDTDLGRPIKAPDLRQRPSATVVRLVHTEAVTCRAALAPLKMRCRMLAGTPTMAPPRGKKCPLYQEGGARDVRSSSDASRGCSLASLETNCGRPQESGSAEILRALSITRADSATVRVPEPRPGGVAVLERRRR